MDREEMVQFIAVNYSLFMEVENTQKLQDEIRNLNDEELEEAFDFTQHLWEIE